MIQVVIFENVFEPDTKREFLLPTSEPVALATLLPEDIEIGVSGVTVTVNGEERIDGDVNPGEQVVMVVNPEWVQVAIAVISIFVSIAITSAMMDDIADDPVEEENESESFQGFRNSYFSGGSIPIVLGERRVAPPVVGQIVESAYAAWTLSDRETLRLLFVLGHGPIEGLGKAAGVVSNYDEFVSVAAAGVLTPGALLTEKIGLKINGQDASNFTDVFVQWRTGELTQTAIDGYPDSSVDVVIDQTVKEYSDSIDITDIGYPSGIKTVGNEIDGTLGESLTHVMDDEAHRYVLTFTFEKGLYKDVGGGGTAPATASIRVQFWPVDSVGTRTGDTVLLPEIHITGESTIAQTYNITGGLFSPQSYTPTKQLGYLSCFRNTRYAKVSAPLNSAALPAQFAAQPSFSASCWVRFKEEDIERLKPVFLSYEGTIANSTWDSINHWPYYVQGAQQGMLFGIERRYYNFDPEQSGAEVGGWDLCIYTWNNNHRRIRKANSSFSPNVWYHVGFSHDGETNKLVFYVNGNEHANIDTVSQNYSASKPNTIRMYQNGDLIIGHNGTTGPKSINNVDDVDLCDLIIADGVKPKSWFMIGANTIDNYGHNLTSFDPLIDDSIVFASRLSEEIATGKIEQLKFPGSTTVGECVETVGASLQAAPQIDTPIWETDSGVPLYGRYQFEVFRSNAALDDNGVGQSVMTWDAVTLVTDEAFSHPGVAMGGLSIDADEQVNNSRPDFTMLMRGVKVPVWNGTSSEYPVFVDQWTRNPAWCAYYIAVEEEAALGAVFGHTGGVDLEAFKAWADYADEGVEDAAGVPAFFDGDYVAISGDHPYGEVHLKISLLDNLGASTGEIIPKTWQVGSTIKIKTASDASWLVASNDAAARLTITSLKYESDSAAPLGSQHWVQIEADWVDGYTLPTALNVTGTAVGVESRHECDAIIDTKDSDGWGELTTLMRASRVSPIIIGNKLSCYIDRARPVDFFITQAQTVKDSLTFSWASTEDRYNSVEFEYADRNHDYAVEPLQEDHPSISGEVGSGVIRKAPPRFLKGVVRRSEVRRQAIYKLNRWALIDTNVQFKLGVDGIGLAPGDHIRLAHDVPFIGESGRVYADSASATVIRLDRDVVVTNGSTYEVEVRSSRTVDGDGDEILEVVSIDASMIPGSGSSTLAAGSSITLASPGFATMLPEQGDVYSFGKTGLTAEDFTVTRVTLEPKTLVRTVTAETYNADVYVDNEFGDLPVDPIITLGEDGVGDGSGLGGQIKRPGDNVGSVGGESLQARDITFLGAGGKPEVGVEISWAKTTYGSEAAGGTNVWMASLTDGAIPAPRKVAHAPRESTSAKLVGLHIRSGQSVRFYIQHLNISGEGRTAAMCPSVDMVVGARARNHAHPAPTVTAAKTRQSHAVYPVTFPEGQTPEGVEVRVGGWLLGQKVSHALRDGDLSSDQWVYGANNAALEGAYTHQVRSLIGSGQVSAAATFKNGDALPLGMTASSDIAHEDAWGSGTLDGMQVTDGYLEFSSGTHTEGSFTTPALDLGVACRWMLEIAAQGEQWHPNTLEDMQEPLGSRVYANWLLEGPTGGDDAVMSRLSLEWLPTDTATLPGSTAWATVRPGEVYFRKAKFRVRVVRPRSQYNCKIRRFGVRVLDLPDYHPGDLDGGTF